MDVRHNPLHAYTVLIALLVSGLLVTGPEGTGKTSVVNTVAKLLEEDIRTLTCKRHSHRRNHTHHLPAWHAPSILVFDNLDKLLSAEVEVRIFTETLAAFCIVI